MRKVICALLFLVFFLNLTGCFDATEIDDVLDVVTLGIDKGVADRWRITVQFNMLKEGAGGESGEGGSGGSGGGDSGTDNVTQDGYTIQTIDAPTFFEGLDMLNAVIPRKMSFNQTQTIILSDEIAKEGLLEEYISPLIRFVDLRRASYFIITKGKATDFIKENKPYIGTSIAKNFRIWVEESKKSGYFPYVTIGQFYQNLKSTKLQAIATMAAVNDFSSFQKEGEQKESEITSGGHYEAGKIPRFGSNKPELFGTALFDGATMVGELTGDETRCMLMLRNEFSQGNFTIRDPDRPELLIPLNVHKSKATKVRVKIIDDIPHINVRVFLNGELLAIQSGISYENPELKKTVEQAYIQQMEKEINSVIEKCQKLNVDPFKFGNAAVRNFLTITQLEDYDWNKRFRDAVVEVSVDFVIRRTGKIIRNTPIDR